MKARFCRIGLAFTSAILLSTCSRLPALRPVPLQEGYRSEHDCLSPFPTRPWRAVHAMHVAGPYRNRASVVGVTIVDPSLRRIRATIFSVEGIVLLDAVRQRGETTIHRALPPLDSQTFVKGLFEDVGLMFLAPESDPDQIGRSEDGDLVCRFEGDRRGTTDVVFPSEGTWLILRYGKNQSLEAGIEAHGTTRYALGERMELEVYGRGGYTIDLKLLEVEFLTEVESFFR